MRIKGKHLENACIEFWEAIARPHTWDELPEHEKLKIRVCVQAAVESIPVVMIDEF
jgi:hypothetical protein